jgi:hypothetical protein
MDFLENSKVVNISETERENRTEVAFSHLKDLSASPLKDPTICVYAT